MYETPVQSQSPPDKLAVLADLTDAVTTAICSVSPHTTTTINPVRGNPLNYVSEGRAAR